MVTSKNPEAVEWRWRLIAKDIIYSEEASEYGVVDDDGADLDEEDGSGSGEVGTITGGDVSET